jgi:hypothetical protein
MKILNKLKKSKITKVAVLSLAMSLVFCSMAFADTVTPTIDIAGPLTTGLNTTVTNTLACFSAIIPIGLTIFCAKFAWVKGIAFFAKIAK